MKGFTLIELMIIIAILGVICGTDIFGLHTMLYRLRHVVDPIDASRSLRELVLRLDKDMRRGKIILSGRATGFSIKTDDGCFEYGWEPARKRMWRNYGGTKHFYPYTRLKLVSFRGGIAHFRLICSLRQGRDIVLDQLYPIESAW